MRIDAPQFAELALLVGSGDTFFATGYNSETKDPDSLLIALVEPGELGATGDTGRDDEAAEAGFPPGDRQTKPALIGLRFTSALACEQLLLEVARLYGAMAETENDGAMAETENDGAKVPD